MDDSERQCRMTSRSASRPETWPGTQQRPAATLRCTRQPGCAPLSSTPQAPEPLFGAWGEETDSRWEISLVAPKLPPWADSSGLSGSHRCAGLFGIGGGIIKGPLMLKMGMLPEV